MVTCEGDSMSPFFDGPPEDILSGTVVLDKIKICGGEVLQRLAAVADQRDAFQEYLRQSHG